jgi:aspartyl/asparaginyl beta-hydroxylase (cupin superfamily)
MPEESPARKRNLPIRFELYREMMKRFDANGRSGPFPLQSPFALQMPETYYPGLDTRLVHDKRRFEWVPRLEAAWTGVRAELDALLRNRTGFSTVYGKHTEQGEWAGCFFAVFGRRIDATCERCPETVELLESIPGAIECGTALFSALGPHTRVAPHCGNTNFKLRCQLPLDVPDGCRFTLADQQIEATAGECFIFDDSFSHSVWNRSDRPRFVLIFDVYHPDLTGAEREALAQLTLQSNPHSYYFDFIESGQSPDWVYNPVSRAGN